MRKMHLRCLSGHHHDRQRGNGGSLVKQNPVPVMFIVRSLLAYRETGYLKAHRIDFKIAKINKPAQLTSSSPLQIRSLTTDECEEVRLISVKSPVLLTAIALSGYSLSKTFARRNFKTICQCYCVFCTERISVASSASHSVLVY